MNIALAILLIIYIVTIIISMVLDKKQQDLVEEMLNFELRLIEEKRKILEIIIYAELNNEEPCFTLNKIKELVRDNQSIN